MANHGFVKTKKFMSADKINDLLLLLNKSYFKNNLEILNENNYWLIKYPNYGTRRFWLNSKRSFEMRHCGPGHYFIWWVDHVITNEIAVRFDGIITDEGHEFKSKGNRKYHKFSNYLNLMLKHIKDESIKKKLLKLEMKLVPKEFYYD